MPIELFSVQKVLTANVAAVELRCGFMDAEHMFFEIVAFSEGLEIRKRLENEDKIS